MPVFERIIFAVLPIIFFWWPILLFYHYIWPKKRVSLWVTLVPCLYPAMLIGGIKFGALVIAAIIMVSDTASSNSKEKKSSKNKYLKKDNTNKILPKTDINTTNFKIQADHARYNYSFFLIDLSKIMGYPYTIDTTTNNVIVMPDVKRKADEITYLMSCGPSAEVMIRYSIGQIVTSCSQKEIDMFLTNIVQCVHNQWPSNA